VVLELKIFVCRFQAKEKEEKDKIVFANGIQRRDGEKERRVMMLYEKVVSCAQQQKFKQLGEL
jgi:hypothetical protein